METSGVDWGAGVAMAPFCVLKTGSRIAPAEAGSGEVAGTQRFSKL